jgi:hypothetical protein
MPESGGYPTLRVTMTVPAVPDSKESLVMRASFATLTRFQRSAVIFTAVWISGSTIWLGHLG